MATPKDPIPQRFGKYNLLERIGQGGMAEIWLARTLGAEGFTKDLVVKRILPQLCGDADFVRSFIDEARLVSRLQHANIVQIFEFDKVDDAYYLAMEFVDGRDLRQIERAAAKAGCWPEVSMAVYLIAEACKGLHYAHTKTDRDRPLHLVHRDISPHNILVSKSGDVKLADFGIAKVESRASRTALGMVKGKLSYMSPEQITGQPLDARTDIYAMGIVLWELLTRRRLFAGPDHEVALRVRDADIPSPRQLFPDLPPAVEAIVMRMLAADRTRRYQSAGEVARDLCALPCYAYEAERLGALVRRLFPDDGRNLTLMMQSVTDEHEFSGRMDPSPAAKPAPRSIMSDGNKTQIATEIPPEVAARLAQGQGQAPSPGGAPPPGPDAGAGLARTMIAQAPNLNQGPGPSPQAAPDPAKTVMAAAPALPGFAAGPPPSSTAGGQLPPTVAAGGMAQGLPPPSWQGQTGASAPVKSQAPAQGSAQATMIAQAPPGVNLGNNGGATLSPGRSIVPPLPLRPFREVFPQNQPAPAGLSPKLVRWAGGPAVALVVMIFTAMMASRIWPAAQDAGYRGPRLLAKKARMSVSTKPAGATVFLDGVKQDGKTPTEIEGPVGTKARLRLVLDGFQPYEATVPFTAEERPPLNVPLFRPGQGPGGSKEIPADAYDEKPGVKEDPEEGQPGKDKVAAQPGKDPDSGKTVAVKEAPPAKAVKRGPDAEEEEEARAEAEAKAKEEAEAKARAEAEAKAKEEAEAKAKAEGDKKGRRRKGKDKEEAVADAAPKPTKAMLSVTVRPWAIVYVDNKKIKQTPLRDFALSPGKHKVLLVNDTKGKREEVQVNAVAGEPFSINRNWE